MSGGMSAPKDTVYHCDDEEDRTV